MDVFDVFISYARESQADAEQFRVLLEAEGWTVWLDEQIPVGAVWSSQLEKALDIAKGVIVLWTEQACESQWVQKEADYALEQNKLFSIKREDCSIPQRFKRIEAAILVGWKGDMAHPEWSNLLRSLAEHVVPSRKDQLRPGFDSCFLGEDRRIPWPAVYGVARQIHYLHFTVVANPARRLAWYVAYNVDMLQAGDLGDRPIWLTEDQFIAKEFQPSDRHFKGSGYDRGHLACRRSLGWGEERMPGIAGRQAFYLTNIAPQHPAVNRASYLAVEEWEQQVSTTYGHLIVFCGPVLKEDDRIFRDQEIGDDEFIAYTTFRVPQAYWKVVLTLDAKRKIMGRAFVFANPDPDTTGMALSKDVANYDIPIEELQEYLPSIKFPTEITSAEVLPLK
ncbi:MAG: DNA/RNA non-specific endonuclease [Gammaproteobacteria bacterium]|jgi:endonuclease G|nr:DNA/RNA non-specific endonuclease [Gammaproteobacteria bacterium]